MKRIQQTTILIMVIGISLSIIPLYATNVQVSNVNQVNVDADNHRIEFDLSWEDSWRQDNNEPNNYDGVWIFIKYRDCLEKASGNPASYKHAWLSTTATDHSIASATVGGSSMAMEVEVGLTNISGTDRGMGIFIYQPAGDRIGDVTATTVSLLWKTSEHSPVENGTTNNYDIQINAIEMVYVPTSSFYLGDGVSQYRFYDYTNSNAPLQITSNAMDILAAANDYYGRLTPGSGSPNISNSYPNGYDAFWAMKYEISQEQYLQFLNTLSRTVQNTRTASNLSAAVSNVTNTYVMYNSSSINYRNAIVVEPTIPVGGEPVRFRMDYNGNRIYNEAGDGANIACNYLSGYDVLAYLDWAALRPLTEFEYEKMARGPHRGSFGYTQQKAWGNSTVTEVTGISNPGQSDETSSNSGDGICVYNNNASVGGPLRCGFAASPTTQDRFSCGASYYGIYELSGNVNEPYLSIARGTTYDDNFVGNSGDGLISDINGYATQADWPQGVDGTSNGNNYMIYRGGSFATTNVYAFLNISSRYPYNANNTRQYYGGGRGGRFVSH
jgi:formylglycine-generating enzyme required for sulfatase activity